MHSIISICVSLTWFLKTRSGGLQSHPCLLFLLTFKCLNGQGPQYLTDLLRLNNRQELRDQYDNSLLIPKTNLVTCGDRAFEVAAPSLWNALPNNIRSAKTLSAFKSKLKTHMFKRCYPDADNSHWTCINQSAYEQVWGVYISLE